MWTDVDWRSSVAKRLAGAASNKLLHKCLYLLFSIRGTVKTWIMSTELMICYNSSQTNKGFSKKSLSYTLLSIAPLHLDISSVRSSSVYHGLFYI